MIWDVANECCSREALERVQLSRLRETLSRVYARVEHYRRSFDEHGVHPDQLRTLADLQRFPFLTKHEILQHYPFGMLAVPFREVVRIHSSSGTTGNPLVVGYSRCDLEIWSEMVARIVCAAGVTSEDVVQIAFSYGLFTGGFGLHYGLERVGAAVVPASGGNTERQIRLMRDFGTTALVCTPTYALHIAEVAPELSVDPESLKLRLGLFGSEPWSEAIRREIEAKLGLFATDNYGLSEVVGPGVSGECQCRCGLHINEDHFLVEVIDPDTLEVLPEGEVGELVFTTLTKEAFPVVRYRTRDISRITREPCECGRTNARMERVRGRTDDMLIVRGVNVFPSQIEAVLLEIEGTEPHYQIVVDRKGALDDLEVWVEVSENVFVDEWKQLAALQQRIQRRLETVLGISVRIKLVEPKSIERTVGKAKHVVDRRTLT